VPDEGDAQCRQSGRAPHAIDLGIAAAPRAGRKVGICGQAPSDYPEMVRFLVDKRISLNPDAVVRGIEAAAEAGTGTEDGT